MDGRRCEGKAEALCLLNLNLTFSMLASLYAYVLVVDLYTQYVLTCNKGSTHNTYKLSSKLHMYGSSWHHLDSADPA